jgi:hypothetical protein
MTKTGRLQEKAPKTCRECRRWEEVKDKVRIHELVERTIQQFESRIKKKEYEPTVAEYVKLLQLEREIGHEEDEPKEIKVTWVSPTTSDTAT